MNGETRFDFVKPVLTEFKFPRSKSDMHICIASKIFNLLAGFKNLENKFENSHFNCSIFAGSG